MTDYVTLELIGKHALETRDAIWKLAGVPKALHQLQAGQMVMIRMLQSGEAELDLVRSHEQHKAGCACSLHRPSVD